MRLTSVHLHRPAFTPDHTSTPTEFVEGDANEYAMHLVHGAVVVSCPAWNGRTLIIPWANVQNAVGVEAAGSVEEQGAMGLLFAEVHECRRLLEVLCQPSPPVVAGKAK